MKSTTAAAGKYAAGTNVAKGRSMDEIEATLSRFGAFGFSHGQDEHRAAIMFAIRDGSGQERRIRYILRLPAMEDFRFVQRNGYAASTQRRTDTECRAKFQEEVNRRWRSLANGIKAKLAMVEDEIETVEEAFYAHILLPSGQTLFEATQPQVIEAYRGNSMPDLLPGLPPPPPPSPPSVMLLNAAQQDTSR